MNRESLIPPNLPLNLELANNAVTAFNMLHLADVTGTPTMEEAGAEWFRDIVRVVFGCYDPVTRARMIRELFVLVPKKNGKTTYGALLMLLLLLLNERPRAKAIMCAPVKETANIAFDAIAGAITCDPVLDKMLHVRPTVKTIIHRETNAQLQVMTFDPEVLTGQKLFAALIDELHVVAKMVKTPSALRQIRGGMMPFPESLLMYITTQSEEAPSGAFKAELDTARAVRDGTSKARMLPILYEFPKSVQEDRERGWRDPELWPCVTPSVGTALTIGRLIEGMDEAETKGEGELRAWATQHLNIQIGVAIRSDNWIGAAIWEQAECDFPLTLEALIARSEVITVGVDGGGLADLLGLAIVGRDRETKRWLLWTRAWAHKTSMEQHKKSGERLRDFVKLGELVEVERMGQDIDELVGLVMQCETAGLLDRIGLDPHGVGSIVDAFVTAGLAEDRFLGISQGWRLGGAIKTTERELTSGRLVHAGQAMMEWCVGNAKSEPRGNATLITKQASGTMKIDPLMASFNAIHLIASNPASKAKMFQMFVVGGGRSGKAA